MEIKNNYIFVKWNNSHNKILLRSKKYRYHIIDKFFKFFLIRTSIHTIFFWKEFHHAFVDYDFFFFKTEFIRKEIHKNLRDHIASLRNHIFHCTDLTVPFLCDYREKVFLKQWIKNKIACHFFHIICFSGKKLLYKVFIFLEGIFENFKKHHLFRWKMMVHGSFFNTKKICYFIHRDFRKVFFPKYLFDFFKYLGFHNRK